MNQRVAHAVLLFCRALRSRRFLRQESLPAQKLMIEATMAALIDEYSLTAVPLEMRFGETRLSTGTGFIWNNENQLFLITNWHNVTGINPRTGEHLSKNASEPDGIVMLLHAEDYRFEKSAQVQISLRGREGEPLWLEHPLGRKVDVIALPLPSISGAILCPINQLPQTDMLPDRYANSSRA